MKPDQAYARVREHCLAKEGVVEEYPWGDVAWKVRKKLFAVSSDGSHRVTVKSSLEEQSRLIEPPAIEIARGRSRFPNMGLPRSCVLCYAPRAHLCAHEFREILWGILR